MCARLASLYAAPVWAAAAEQVTQNKFLRIILNADPDTWIEALHREAEIQYIDKMIASLLANVYMYDHDDPLIREVDNYSLADVSFKIRCRLPKHFHCTIGN